MVKNIQFKKSSLAKILNTVPFDTGFHFYGGIGNYTGTSATSLAEFAEKLQIVDMNSINFHFQRGDFQKWIKGIIGDPELAKRISLIKNGLSDENLRKELVKTTQTRIMELKTYL